MAQRNEAQVGLIRKRVVNGIGRELASFRSWLSGLEGQGERVEMLRGERGTEILAKAADTVMTELGLGVDLPPTEPMSRVRRAAQGLLGPGKKDRASEE